MTFYAGLRKGSLNLGIISSLQCINFGGMLSAGGALSPPTGAQAVSSRARQSPAKANR